MREVYATQCSSLSLPPGSLTDSLFETARASGGEGVGGVGEEGGGGAGFTTGF